jgi:hypothetical protein
MQLDEDHSVWGNMNLDVDAEQVKSPEIRESHNTQVIAEAENTQLVRQPVKGTALPYDLGSVPDTQDKIIRFTPSLSALTGTDITLFFEDRDTSILSEETGTFSGSSLSDFKTFIDGLITAAGFSYTSATVGTYAVDYTFTDVDLTITCDTVEITVEQELIAAAEGGGVLQPINMVEYEGFQYVWSCNKSAMPSTGYAVGEIGRAYLDENYNTWNYTRLLRSKEFRFLTTAQLDTPKPEKNNYKISIYYTGDNNPPRLAYFQTFPTTFSLDATKTIISPDSSGFDVSKINYLSGVTVRVCGESKTVSSINTSNNTITVSSAFSKRFEGFVLDIQDMALNIKYAGGEYSYDNVNRDISHILNIPTPIISDAIELNGGSIKGGNKTYIVRGITADLNIGKWSRIGKNINIYPDSPSPETVGSKDNEVTDKMVQLTISQINSRFKYIDIAVIEYFGQSVSGTILKRVSVTSETVNILHFGNEVNSEVLDLNEVTDVSIALDKAYTNEIVDNSYVLGNITQSQPPNLQDYFITVTHAIGREVLPVTPTAKDSYGEYMNPENVYNRGSYMYNETYRIGAFCEFANGSNATYYIDDIRIDSSAINISAGTSFNGTILPNRRTSTVSDADITDSTPFPYTFFIEFEIDFNYLYQFGLTRIEIVRSPIVPEVILNGLAVPTSKVLEVPIEVTGNTTSGSQTIENINTSGLSLGMWVSNSIGQEYGQIVLIDVPNNAIVTSLAAAATIVGVQFKIYANLAGSRRPFLLQAAAAISQNLDYFTVTFHSPDNIYGVSSYTFRDGDKIRVIPHSLPKTTTLYSGSLYIQTKGNYTINGDTDYTAGVDIIDSATVTKYASAVLQTVPVNLRFDNIISTGTSPDAIWVGERTLVLSLDSQITSYIPTGTQRPIFAAQIYRELPYINPNICKYGKVSLSTYEPFGGLYTGPLTGTQTLKVYGRHVFTQLSYFKAIYPVNLSPYTATTTGAGYSMYTQNIGNIQMRSYDPSSTTTKMYPNSFRLGDIQNWLSYKYIDGTTIISEQLSYDQSYNYNSLLQNTIGYDNELPISGVENTAVVWSDFKVQNSIFDGYRLFRAGNKKYLNNTEGAIICLAKKGSELYAYQERANYRLFFNTRAEFQGTQSVEVVVGEGAIMNRDGVKITGFGCTHRESLIRARSRSGDDVHYYFDGRTKSIVRSAGDGITVLSQDRNIQSFMNKNAVWASMYHNPTGGFGVHGVYDQGRRQILMTFRGQKRVEDYIYKSYAIGDVVADTTPYQNNFYTLNKILYKSKKNGFLPQPTGLASDVNWEFVPLTDSDYYSWFTIAYSEFTQGFTTFYDFVPKIYGNYLTSFTSSRPVDGTENNIYLHNKGELCKFWDLSGEALEAAPTLSFYMNRTVGVPKRWQLAIAKTNEVPHRIDFECLDANIVTYLTQDKFKQLRKGFWEAPIENDSTVTVDNPNGRTDLKTAQPISSVLKVTYNFGTENQNQKLLNFFKVLARDLPKRQ